MILSILVLIVCILVLLFNNKLREINYMKKIFLFIYICWWLIWIIIANTTYGNTFKLSIKTTSIFLLGVITFAFGVILIDFIMAKRKTEEDKKKINERKVEHNSSNKKLLRNLQLLIQGIIWIILIYYKIKQINVISIYGEEIKRIAIFEIGYIFSSTIEAAIFNYVLSAIISFFNIIMIRDILMKEINISVICQIIISVLYFLITYGRLIFFESILYIVFWIIILYGKNIKGFIKQNKKVLSITSVAAIAILLISSFLRVGINLSDFSTLKEAWERTTNQAVIYFAGGPKAFERALIADYKTEIIQKYGNNTNGMATFAWIEQVVGKLLNKNNSLNNILGEIMQREINIGEYQTINAFFTCFFNFYLDFGYWGIFICQFLYGCFISWLIGFYTQKTSLGRGILLNINLTFAMLSITRWSYQSIQNIILIVISILFIILTEKRKRIKNENNVVM